MNFLTIAGRLVKDPQLKKTKNDKPYAFFCVACDRNYKDKNGKYPTDFMDFIVFDQAATFLTTYGYKGREIVVQGHIEQTTYKSKNGKLKNHLSLKCDDLQLMGPKKKPDGANASGNKEQDKSETKATTTTTTASSSTSSETTSTKPTQPKPLLYGGPYASKQEEEEMRFWYTPDDDEKEEQK